MHSAAAQVYLTWANQPTGTEVVHCETAEEGLPELSEWVLEPPIFSYGDDFWSSTGNERYQKLQVTVKASRHSYM